MMRTWLWRILVAVLLLACVVAVYSVTEWTDKEIQTPMRGEALKNSLYATQQLARRLGAKVQSQPGLDVLPPRSARLVLVSGYWDLLPGRSNRLKEWVEQGGHLIVPGTMVYHDSLEDWLPVEQEDVSSDSEHEPVTSEGKRASRRYADSGCRLLDESGSDPWRTLRGEGLRLCSGSSMDRLTSSEPVRWAAGDAQGSEILRVALGRGTVTVVQPWGVLSNRRLLLGDHAELAVAALQLEPGADVWFVTEESRTPLLPWLWQQAAVVVVLAALALVLALWRSGVRFGPRIPVVRLERRSMVEQLTGTARFLRQHGHAALYQAQKRALDEAARRVLRDYDALDGAARARALAQVTGLDVQPLQQALEPGDSPQTQLQALEMLEVARRRLPR